MEILNIILQGVLVGGAIHTPTMSDALPFTPDDITARSIAAAGAGAAILHLHARRPSDGGVSIDPDDFAAFLPRIKQATGAVVNISTSGSLKTTIEDRITPALRFRPKMCSLNMGSMTFSFHPPPNAMTPGNSTGKRAMSKPPTPVSSATQSATSARLQTPLAPTASSSNRNTMM